jgi:hypothetical protein
VTGLHDVPSAADLVAACLAELRLELREGSGSYQRRVVVATLEIVERELRAGGEPCDAHTARLAGLGYATESELAAAIRSGEVAESDLEHVREAVTADVLARLEVVNPAYTEEYE